MRLMKYLLIPNLLLLPAFLLSFIFTNSAAGQLTVEDVVNLESASQFDISADGSMVVWVKTTPNRSKNRRQSNIMLTFFSDTTTIQLTRGFNTDKLPRFSPRGGKIAFLGSRGKSKTQIYVFDLRGGEPRKLTKSRASVRSYEWIDEKNILFSAREDSTLRENLLKKNHDDAVTVADQEHYPPVRLFSINMQGRIERITRNGGVISEFSVSPDGAWTVTNENQSVDYSYDHRIHPRQFLINLKTRERQEILAAPGYHPFDFKWSSDSRGFYCRFPRASDPADTYVSIDLLYYYEILSGEFKEIPLNWENGLGYSFMAVGNGVIAALADGTEDRIILLTGRDGRYKSARLISPCGKPMVLLSASRSNDLLMYAVSNSSSIPEIMISRLIDGGIKNEYKLIDLNEKLKTKTLARSEVISWKGAGRDEVEGILYYPPGWEKGKTYPLIALIHGGPTGVDRNYFSERWSNYPHVLASRGTFVLKVNYHGSGNYGLKWMESIKESYYELEVPDILKGIDRIAEEGLVDKNKIGIMGWSNGSILAIECCLRSDRFKVLCAGAGDVNWTSDYGNCAFGAAFDNAYFGGPPWEKLRTYIDKSPLFRMDKMHTPTLILFGTKDTNVPTQQGWEHFRAMQQIGRTPVRFVLFPGASHGLRKLSHQARKMNEELEWFDRYLFADFREKNEAFDEESPLARALKKAASKKTIGIYGEANAHMIIPETVPFNGIRVGRFEITNAQYGSFNINHSFTESFANYPAAGISFEQAQLYCEWLSVKTSRSFRLPTSEEMTKLLELAKPNLANENNLEYWAGYSPTPDEMDLVKEKIEELEKTRLLLEEAGSFKPVGDGTIYDLGGNVSEWVTTNSGGKVMGLSAVSTRDERVSFSPPPSKYIGFRVCEDAPNKTAGR